MHPQNLIENSFIPYSFNGMETDDEVKGEGNSYDFGARMLDARVGRWLSVDPKQHPTVSLYNAFDNNPIVKNDPDGKDAVITVKKNEGGGGQITISSKIYFVGKGITQEQLDAAKSDFDALVKNGSYKDIEGNVWEIMFDVTFISGGDVNAQELSEQIQEGDNVVDLTSSGHAEGLLVVNRSKPYGAPDSEIKVNSAHQSTSNMAHVGSLEDSPVIIHELLHLLGLVDRYENSTMVVSFSNGTTVSRVTSVPDKGWANDIMSSTQGGEEFSQTHLDNYGRAYSIKNEGEYLLDYAVDVNLNTGEKIGKDKGGLSSEEKKENSKTSSKPRF